MKLTFRSMITVWMLGLSNRAMVRAFIRQFPCEIAAQNEKMMSSVSLWSLSAKKGGEHSGKKYTKSNLPTKVCEVCGRPFAWRKKWEKVWDEVKYCSDRCRANRNKSFLQKSLSSSIDNSHTLLHFFLTFLLTITPYSLHIQASDAIESITLGANKVMSTIDWNDVPIFGRSDFRRLDESDDSLFYAEPRFVEHIDENAVRALSKFHEEKLSALTQALRGPESNGLRIIDLCSSWVSHVPDTVSATKFTILGMNKAELDRNPRATERILQNLNNDATLYLPSSSYDAVLLQLSIDYLTNPVEVLKEVHRVLRPGGQVLISFSNRVFIDKAVALWTGKSDLDHLETIEYYLFLGGFEKEDILAESLVQEKGKDPLYVVSSTKR